ncbi:YIP1 family protein [Thioclava sp. BHET1]|nr:YIP1 family protein [Thioclava sp. BHET1]
MPTGPDVATLYLAPGRAMRRQLRLPRREDRALALLMAALGLIFIGRLPVIAQGGDASVPLDARIGGALMGLFFVAPLLAYGLAGLSHLVLRACGGRGDGYGARLALFRSLLACSPLMLLQGFVAGLIGPGAILTVLEPLVLAVFLWLWIGALCAVASGPDRAGRNG